MSLYRSDTSLANRRLTSRSNYPSFPFALFFTMNISKCDSYKPYMAPLTFQGYLIPGLFVLIFILGLIGNITIIYVILRRPSMKTVPNLMIVNLSLGDVVLLLSYLIFYIPSYIFSTFYGEKTACALRGFLNINTLGVSIFTLTFMAIDRFRAITRPMHQKAMSPCALAVVMLGIWVAATLLALPVTLNSDIREIKIDYTCSFIRICYSEINATKYKDFDYIVWINFSIYFVVPFLIISFCYIAISISLCRHQANDDPKSGLQIHRRRQMKSRRKLAIIVLVLVFMFAICRLPKETHVIYREHREKSIEKWQTIGNLLSNLYSCVNPIILCILSPMFRRLMFKIWYPCMAHEEDYENYQSMPLNHTNVIVKDEHIQHSTNDLTKGKLQHNVLVSKSPQKKVF